MPDKINNVSSDAVKKATGRIEPTSASIKKSLQMRKLVRK